MSVFIQVENNNSEYNIILYSLKKKKTIKVVKNYYNNIIMVTSKWHKITYKHVALCTIIKKKYV